MLKNPAVFVLLASEQNIQSFHRHFFHGTNRLIRVVVALFLLAFPALGDQPKTASSANSINLAEPQFIFQSAPFAECHASTLCETQDGLLAAWFAGTAEKNPDVGIWLTSKKKGENWASPREIVNGIQFQSASGNPVRYACWNPVLVRESAQIVHLFYKVGLDPTKWWGMVMTSSDSGQSWSEPRRLPEGILGPIKNKGVWLGNRLLCPASTEGPAGWRIHFELSSPPWSNWTRTDSLGGKSSSGDVGGGIQPTILSLGNNHLKALCRCDGRVQRILETHSTDGGLHWSELQATALPNPNSGIDAVTLSDGRHLLVYNHTIRKGDFPSGREMLNVAISSDSEKWFAVATIAKQDGQEFSYPAVIQTSDGQVHITYTWGRKRIAHVELNPKEIQTDTPIESIEWPTIDEGKK